MKIKSGLIVALAAGSIAGIAQADQLDRQALRPTGSSQAHGHVYINGMTGERVFSFDRPQPVGSLRGGFTWDLSIGDPCGASIGLPPEDQVQWVWSALHDAAAGDAITPDAIGYWHEWMEVPGDTIIDCMQFGYWSQVLDPEEDGVVGHDFLMTFTENDSAPTRSQALASLAVLVEELPGADDEDGNGDIPFAEGNLWLITLDFAGGTTPTDLELADTNATSDGAFGDDSLYSGIPGVDLDGDGLYNVGFVWGMRQPNVAEGDGLIDRFPELAGLGLENPDGLNVGTFPNIVPVGSALVNPSEDPACYFDDNPNAPDGNNDWPQVVGCGDEAGRPAGTWDAFGLIDATGVDIGAFFFGGFACQFTDPTVPRTDNPWSGPWFRFNLDCDDGPAGCNAADIAEPFNVLDLGDIQAFIIGFQAGDPVADLAAPFGVFDLADIQAFIVAFQAGCP